MGTEISSVKIMETSEVSKQIASKLTRCSGVVIFIFLDLAEQVYTKAGPMKTHLTSVVSENKEGAKFSFIEKRLAIAPVMVRIIHRWSPITHSYRITTVSDGKIT